MQTVLADSLARQRFQMEILGGFAVLALLLAAVGLYGVLSYMVTANRAEIGIRLALGASPSAVFRMITGRALALACLGVCGWIGCPGVRRRLVPMLFGIRPNNPGIIAGAVATLFGGRWRAGGVMAWFPGAGPCAPPMVALREE